METGTKKLYEAMFLIDSAQAAADWDGINATIKGILEKFGAEIVSIRKWMENKLAYPIHGKTRGAYILCYFKSDGTKIHEIERDIRLSEKVMRALILSGEHLTQADMEKDTPAMLAEKGLLPPAENVQAERQEVIAVEDAGDVEPLEQTDEKI